MPDLPRKQRGQFSDGLRKQPEKPPSPTDTIKKGNILIL